MKSHFKKIFPVLLIIICFFSYSISVGATGVGKVNCDCSKRLLSDMVAFPIVINDKSGDYGDEIKENLSTDVEKIFTEWKTINYRKPENVKINCVRVVPITDKLLYDELNSDFQECYEYVKKLELEPDEDFNYAICYEYATKTFFGGENENKAYCLIGKSNDNLISTMVDDLEASDSTIAACAITNYSGSGTLILDFD